MSGRMVLVILFHGFFVVGCFQESSNTVVEDQVHVYYDTIKSDRDEDKYQVFHYKDSTLKEVTNYLLGVKHGEYTAYFDHSEDKRLTGYYFSGGKSGFWTYYDQEGSVLRKEDYMHLNNLDSNVFMIQREESHLNTVVVYDSNGNVIPDSSRTYGVVCYFAGDSILREGVEYRFVFHYPYKKHTITKFWMGKLPGNKLFYGMPEEDADHFVEHTFEGDSVIVYINPPKAGEITIEGFIDDYDTEYLENGKFYRTFFSTDFPVVEK